MCQGLSWDVWDFLDGTLINIYHINLETRRQPLPKGLACTRFPETWYKATKWKGVSVVMVPVMLHYWLKMAGYLLLKVYLHINFHLVHCQLYTSISSVIYIFDWQHCTNQRRHFNMRNYNVYSVKSSPSWKRYLYTQLGLLNVYIYKFMVFLILYTHRFLSLLTCFTKLFYWMILYFFVCHWKSLGKPRNRRVN